MIHIRDVSFAYRRGAPVLENIHLTFEPGRVYGLLGLNGVGKTTLMHLIGGGLLVQEGTVETLGLNPSERPVGLLSQLYLVTADLYLPKCSIAEYADRYKPFYPNFDETLFQRALGIMRLTPDMLLHNISFGQRKKAVLCFALATQCSILLLDEPTDGLDSPSKAQFRRLLSEYIDDNRILIIATHHVQDVSALLDQVVILDQQSVLTNMPIGALSERFAIRTATQLPADGSVLYSERIPGGHRYLIYNKPGSGEAELDLEFVFNAVTENRRILE